MQERTNNKKTLDMTQGSILKALVTFAVPIILSEILQEIYNVCDSIIVGQFVGKLALAAVNGTSILVFAVVGSSTGFATGATVIISRLFGAKDFKSLNDAVNSIMKFSFILMVAFTALAQVALPFLVKISKLDAEIVPDATAYLRIYFLGIAAQIGFNMIAGILKSLGDSKRPLYALIITAVVNILLDLLFVCVFHWGVKGAAWATIIAQYISFVSIWFMMARGGSFEKPIIRKDPINWRVVKQVVIIGLPVSIHKALISFSNVIVQSYVNNLGVDITAAWGVYRRLDQIIINTIMGLNAALTTFVAQHTGAKSYTRIAKGVKICLALCMGVVLVYATVFTCFREFWVSLFSSDAQVIFWGAYILSFMPFWNVINCIPQTLCGAVNGKGKSIQSTAMIIFNYVLLRQIYLHLNPACATDLKACIMAWPWSFVTCSLCMLAVYFYYKRKDGY